MKYLPSVFDIFTLIYFTWTSAFFSRLVLQKFLRNGISSQEIIRLHCFQSHKPTLIRRFGHGMVDMIYDIESTRHLSSSNPLIPLHLFLEFSKSFYGEGHLLYIIRQMNIILKDRTYFLLVFYFWWFGINMCAPKFISRMLVNTKWNWSWVPLCKHNFI